MMESNMPNAASIPSTALIGYASEKQASKTTRRIVSEAMAISIVIASLVTIFAFPSAFSNISSSDSASQPLK